MVKGAAVALLGTGLMGTGMARSLLRAGHTVHVWNRTAAKSEALVAQGAVAEPSPARAVGAASTLITMLADGAVTASVMREALAAANADTLWLQMGTVGLAAIRDLASLAEVAGVGFVDAPVMGSRDPAERGELDILAAGPAALRAASAPVFDAVGRRTLWLGEQVGTASALKLAVNAFLDSSLAAVAESLRLTEALGLPAQRFLEAITGGPVDSPYVQAKGRAMLDGAYRPNFPLALALKDIRLVLEAAAEAGVALPMATVGASLFEVAVRSGHGEDDMAAVYEATRPGRRDA